MSLICLCIPCVGKKVLYICNIRKKEINIYPQKYYKKVTPSEQKNRRGRKKKEATSQRASEIGVISITVISKYLPAFTLNANRGKSSVERHSEQKIRGENKACCLQENHFKGYLHAKSEGLRKSKVYGDQKMTDIGIHLCYICIKLYLCPGKRF